jgi:hypothetical protein
MSEGRQAMLEDRVAGQRQHAEIVREERMSG